MVTVPPRCRSDAAMARLICWAKPDSSSWKGRGGGAGRRIVAACGRASADFETGAAAGEPGLPPAADAVIGATAAGPVVVGITVVSAEFGCGGVAAAGGGVPAALAGCDSARA